MSDRILLTLFIFYLLAIYVVAWAICNPSYHWTPREVAREHIYDETQSSNR